MLIELFGRNFASFRDEFHLSMLATDIDRDDPRGVVEVPIQGDDEPLRLLRCAAIYGPNASGKSNLLRAARALGYLLYASGRFPSDEPLKPYEPFGLDEASGERPILLGLRAVIDQRVYEYRIEFTEKAFVHEQLIELAPEHDAPLFIRRAQDVDGAWTASRQFALLAESFRPNALLLSLADRLAPALAQGIAVGLRRLLDYYDPTWYPPRLGSERAARLAATDQVFGRWLLELLRAADIGIVDYQAERVAERPRDEDEGDEESEAAVRYSLRLAHAGPGGPVPLSFYRESVGTRRVVELSPLLHSLMHGEYLRSWFVDEIGASMHPELLEALIRRFNCQVEPTSVRGQLVFATHETGLLDAEAKDAVLRRDQIYLTEKDSTGASRLYSVAEFKERNNLNLRRRYLHGRYGALPAVGILGD
jgi:hypothetical protein